MVDPSPASGPLGWSCIGAPDGNEAERTRTHVICALFTKEPVWSDGREICCDIDNSLKRFWEIEKSGTERTDRLVLTEEERLALNKVSVPRKDKKPELPDTKLLALSHLRSTEKSLKKDDRVAEEYKATITTIVERGYLLMVPSDEQLPNNVWYLPLFPVLRMDKTTTKVPIVFHYAAKCNGISLSAGLRLVRVHARVTKVLHNLRGRDNRKIGIELSPEEIKDAKVEIVSLTQREAFRDEFAALSLGIPLPQKSQLIKLNQCIDEDSVIWCHGRLKFAEFLPATTDVQSFCVADTG